MKYILGFFAILFFLSCDNELDLVSEFKDVPVVYGVLDLNEPAQYLRIERGFADKAISANIIAQNPDSLYYDDITVRLVNLNSGLEFTLEEVDGNLEGIVRDTGVFAQAPNTLYKLVTTPDLMERGDSVRLEIDGVFDDRPVTATTDIFEEPFFVTPFTLSFERDKKSVITWSESEETRIYSAAFLFPIIEVNSDGSPNDTLLLRWEVLNNSEESKIEVEGISFFSFLRSELEEDPSITRFLSSGQLEITTGNSVMADFIRVGQANLGITSSGEIPIFTNITDGLGLFGTKYVDLRTNIPFRQVMIDSLRNGSITKDLNFQ